MMTRQDFVAIADVLYRFDVLYRLAKPDFEVTPADRKRYKFLVQEMASVCAESNPNFNKEKFFEACGLELAK